jgi:hypothetical protein
MSLFCHELNIEENGSTIYLLNLADDDEGGWTLDIVSLVWTRFDIVGSSKDSSIDPRLGGNTFGWKQS